MLSIPPLDQRKTRELARGVQIVEVAVDMQCCRAREISKVGVEAALKSLGSGFLMGNPDLRRRVQSSELPLTYFFRQLLYGQLLSNAASRPELLRVPEPALLI